MRGVGDKVWLVPAREGVGGGVATGASEIKAVDGVEGRGG